MAITSFHDFWPPIYTVIVTPKNTPIFIDKGLMMLSQLGQNIEPIMRLRFVHMMLNQILYSLKINTQKLPGVVPLLNKNHRVSTFGRDILSLKTTKQNQPCPYNRVAFL